MEGAQSVMQANLAIDRHRGYSDCMLCRLLACQHALLTQDLALDLYQSIPCFSSCFSISSCVRPNSLHSPICKLISCLMCVTMAAPWKMSDYLQHRRCFLLRSIEEHYKTIPQQYHQVTLICNSPKHSPEQIESVQKSVVTHDQKHGTRQTKYK
jgi:hypothetical protein